MGSNGLGSLNSDEFETMFELVITIMFMAFGALAMSFMVKNMAERSALMNQPDKIEVEVGKVEDDPFWFTGYQAYMFSWHMDELSYESLSWLGNGSYTEAKSSAHTDGSDTYHVNLGVVDEETGEIIKQFYPWRNQRITGVGPAGNLSVKKTIKSCAQSSESSLVSLYKGTLEVPGTGGKHKMFHLELTDDYTISDDLGTNPNTGGKKFRWILAPYSH